MNTKGACWVLLSSAKCQQAVQQCVRENDHGICNGCAIRCQLSMAGADMSAEADGTDAKDAHQVAMLDVCHSWPAQCCVSGGPEANSVSNTHQVVSLGTGCS